ncbi:MAG: hypothetical protein V4685_07740 [Bacteroidota bacterium]
MDKLFSFILFLITVSITHAQSNSINGGHTFIISPGTSYQSQFFAELNLMYAGDKSLNGGPCSGSFAAGPRIGVEYNFNSSNNIIAPKIGYEVSGLVICLRANAVYYIGKHINDLRLLPEAGFSLTGAINLTYGFSIPLLSNRLTEVSRSRITLTFNCNKKLWRQF